MTVGRIREVALMSSEEYAAPQTGIRNWWGNSRTFLTEVRNEMRRVTWPSRREVYATTVVVILTAVFFGMYLWGLDIAINTAVNWIYRQFGAA
jgi:preprotein translocase subunit SecE